MPSHSVVDESTGATAIEVVALLGDSVVDVTHCIDPKGGAMRRGTRAWFVAAAVAFALAAVAFAASVRVAARNQRRLDQWTRVMKRPAYAFRAESLGVTYDALAFGGLAFTVLAAGAGLARRHAERRAAGYRIGTAPGVELATSDAPAPAFPLVAPSPAGDDFVLTYVPALAGELTRDGATAPLADLAQRGRPSARVAGAVELPIPANATIRATAGRTTFLISGVPAPRRHAAAVFDVDRRVARYIAGSLAVHLILLGVLAQLPYGDGAASIDLGGQELVGIESRTGANEPNPPPASEPGDDGGGQTAGAAATPLDSAHPAQTAEAASYTLRQDGPIDLQAARAQAIEQARTASILGVLRADQFEGLVAIGNVTDGAAYGWLDASDGASFANGFGGTNGGSFGTGISGFGGGGAGWGTIASGHYSTSGYGFGDGPGGIGDHGLLGTRRHVATAPTVTISQPSCDCGPDRAVIRRYIRRNLEKITYCYEKELLARPAIGGDVVVQFFIADTGKVTGAAGSGFDAEVASCVAGVVADIEFPRMQSGVTVNYPFAFRAKS